MPGNRHGGFSAFSGSCAVPFRPGGSARRRGTALQNLTLSWQSAGATAAVLLTASYAVHRTAPSAGPGRRRTVVAVLREAGTLLALFALWQLVGQLSVMSTDHALDRAEWIHRTELRLGLPDEASWQQAITPLPGPGPAAELLLRRHALRRDDRAAGLGLPPAPRRYALGPEHRGADDGGLPAASSSSRWRRPRMLPDSGFVDVAAAVRAVGLRRRGRRGGAGPAVGDAVRPRRLVRPRRGRGGDGRPDAAGAGWWCCTRSSPCSSWWRPPTTSGPTAWWRSALLLIAYLVQNALSGWRPSSGDGPRGAGTKPALAQRAAERSAAAQLRTPSGPGLRATEIRPTGCPQPATCTGSAARPQPLLTSAAVAQYQATRPETAATQPAALREPAVLGRRWRWR